MRILIIEDEYNLADVIASRLKKEKYAVDIFCDGEEGLTSAITNIYDLIILDVMLPKINGFEILDIIRKKQVKSKVIMLTAKTLLEDKLNGFNKGANDYVTKPTMDGNSVNRERGNFKGNMKPGSEGNLSIDSTDTGNTNTSET